jgi:Alpha/beta hydrolase domain
MKRILALCAFLCCVLGATADARVVRVEIVSRTDINDGKAFDAAGPYEKIVARVFFADKPGTKANASIVDLDLAPRDANGDVTSSADLVILRPKTMELGNGSAIVEIPNRGGKGILSYLNHAVGSADPSTSAEMGDGFLMRHGFTVAWIGWQWDVTDDTRLMHFAAPVVTDHGKTITGPVRSDFVPADLMHEVTIGDRGHTSYPIADQNDPRNVLTERDSILGTRRVVPRSSWRFARWVDGQYAPSPNYIASADGFTPGHIYELVYIGKNPVVAGLGFAAVRDVVSYLKNDKESVAPVKRVLGFGISQSGRFLRTMLYDGLNSDENGALAFDGIFADVGGAGRGSFNVRFAQPSRDGPSFSSFLYPTDLFPFTDAKEHDPFGHPDDGLLTHSGAIDTPVKIMYSFGAYEYWSRGASLTHTTPDGTADADLPENVRIYSIAGSQHNPGRPTRTTPQAQQPTNPNDFSWALRSFIVHLDHWVIGDGVAPASAYPTISQMTLAPLADVHFPAIPGVGFPKTYHHEFALDFGPQFITRGIDTIEPPRVGAEYGVRFPQVDVDGNELDGVRMSEVAVPLGTYTGWNFRTEATGFPTELVDFTGMFLPFARNPGEVKAGDPRRPISQRYRNKDEYLDLYSRHSQDMIEGGYLLPEDIEGVQKRAETLWHDIMETPNKK